MTETAVSSIASGLILAATSASAAGIHFFLVRAGDEYTRFRRVLGSLGVSLVVAAFLRVASVLGLVGLFVLTLGLALGLFDAFLQFKSIQVIRGKILPAQIARAVKFQGALDFSKRHGGKFRLAHHR